MLETEVSFLRDGPGHRPDILNHPSTSERPAEGNTPPWSAVVINYNGEGLLVETISSLVSVNNPPSEVIVVDDGSVDNGLAQATATHPWIKVVSLGTNTACTSKVRNVGLAIARERYVLVTDNDISFLPDTVQHMMDVIVAYPDAAACTPVVYYEDKPDEICNFGHRMHFLCWSSFGSEPVGSEPKPAIGCGIQLIDRVRCASVGGFDETLTIGWGDDGEFHHRLQIAGTPCYSVPKAHVLHRRERRTARYYGQLRNRWIILAKCYQAETLVLLAPSLLIFEAMLAGYLLVKGRGREYVRAARDVWRLRKEIVAGRRVVRAVRQRQDYQLLTAGLITLSKRERSDMRFLAHSASWILAAYWNFCAQLIKIGGTVL